MKILPILKSILNETKTVPNIIYHGGDIDNLKQLKNKFEILTPEQKREFPSTGMGYIGLSASTDKSKARRYSQVFGNNLVLEIKIIGQLKILWVDTKNKAIDEIFTQKEIEKYQNEGYDAIIETTDDFESEVRILSAKHFKPLGII